MSSSYSTISYDYHVTVSGYLCAEHGVLWLEADQVLQRPANRDIVGHTRIDYRPDGGIAVYWHPLDVLPGSPGPGTPSARAESPESPSSPHVIFLNLEPALARLVTGVLTLEGIAVVVVRTAAEAFAALRRPAGRRSVVVIDNLHGFAEGQQFLEHLRHEPDLRPRARTVCMAARANCAWAAKHYGDVLDADLYLPFTISSLVEKLQAVFETLQGG
jgi:hypothetical protein